jgi:hypothetical protein
LGLTNLLIRGLSLLTMILEMTLYKVLKELIGLSCTID